MKTKRNIFDYKHVQSVSAYALTNDTGTIKGKIIANWSDNPAGSVCTAQVILYGIEDYECLKVKTRTVYLMDEKTELPVILIGKAGGYGYDKLSSAIASAISDNCSENPYCNFAGVGMCGGVDKWFKEHLNLNIVSIIG